MSSKKDLANDLLNLEINVILVDGISSRKLPPVKVLLLEIAEKYKHFIDRIAPTAKAGTKNANPDEAASTPSKPDNTVFAGLLARAKRLTHPSDKDRAGVVTLTLETRNVLRRIQRNCQSLEQTLAANTSLEFNPQELIRIRKIWEVGVERVLMQTVVQLDGDILTRIQSGRETEKDQVLHAIHKDLVNLAVANWQFMVKTLTDLVKSGLGIFRR